MDTGKGSFEILEALGKTEEQLQAEKQSLEEKYPNRGGWFTVGEIIEIRGSKFRVKSVKPTELRLKLLPKDRK